MDPFNIEQGPGQEMFERKVIKKILPFYKKVFNPSREEIQHVDTLERLGNLEHYGCPIGGCKVKQPMQIGNLLNSFNKSVVSTALSNFINNVQENFFEFVVDISSSTALYVLIPTLSTPEVLLENARFYAVIRWSRGRDKDEEPIQMTLLRLDDYLNTKWEDFYE